MESKNNNLGDRMKSYEQSSRNYIDHQLPAIIRLDGHKFSKFTKGLIQPYEQWLHETLVKVTAQLVSTYDAVIGYTQSDEITLVLISRKNEDNTYQNYLFGNQVQKYVSLIAADATNLLTNEIHQLIETKKIPLDLYRPNVCQKLKNPRCYFDARIFNVPNLIEAFNNIYWRANYDCIRNSISKTAQTYFSHKSLMGLNSDQLKDKLMIEKNINWENLDSHFKYGTFVKSVTVQKPVDEQYKKYNDCEMTIRHQLVAFSLNLCQTYSNYMAVFFDRGVSIDSITDVNPSDIYNIQLKNN